MDKNRYSNQAIQVRITILKLVVEYSFIVAGTSDGRLVFWEIKSLDYQSSLYVHQTAIHKLIPIKSMVVSASRHSIVITDIEQMLNIHQFDIFSPISVMKKCYSDLFITGSSNGSLQVWSISNRKLISCLGSDKTKTVFGFKCLKLIENASLAVTTGMDKKVRIWDLKKFKCVQELKNRFYEDTKQNEKEKLKEKEDEKEEEQNKKEKQKMVQIKSKNKKKKKKKINKGPNLNLCVEDSLILTISADYNIKVWEKHNNYELKLLLNINKAENSLMQDMKMIYHQSTPHISVTLIMIFSDSLKVYKIIKGQIFNTFTERFGLCGPYYYRFRKCSENIFLCLTQDPEICIWEFLDNPTMRTVRLERVPTYLCFDPTKKFAIYTEGLDLYKLDLTDSNN